MNKKILFSVILCLISIILGSVLVAATTTLNETAFQALSVPVNNSIQTGRITMNITLNATAGKAQNINVTYIVYNITRSDVAGTTPQYFCTNTSVPFLNTNVTQCTNDTRLFPDGVYNVTIFISNGSSNATPGVVIVASTVVANISFENYGPTVIVTGPGNSTGNNGTSLANADFINRVFDINVSLIDNVAAQNRSFFCELHIRKSLVQLSGTAGLYLNTTTSFTQNKTVIFSNASNFTFKVRSTEVLLNNTINAYGVSCRNSEQNDTYNLTIPQRLVVSDVVLPANVTKPIFKDSRGEVQTKFGFGDKIAISECSGNDNLDEKVQFNVTIKLPGIQNFSLNNVSLNFADTKELGIFQINCSASDSSGNINSSLAEFEIVPKVRADTFNEDKATEKPKGEILVAPGTTSEIALKTEGEARLMAEGSSLTFRFKNEQHTLKVIDVTKNDVEVEISSEHIKFRLKKGESKEVDLDNDGSNDVEVTLNMILSKKADIIVSVLSQPIKEEKEEVNLPSKRIVQRTNISWTPILIVLIVIIVLFLMIYYFKHRGRGGGNIKFTSKDLGLNRSEEEIRPYQPPQGYKFPGR
jgi:hypothetical protein